LAQGPDEKRGFAGRISGFMLFPFLPEEQQPVGGLWPAADNRDARQEVNDRIRFLQPEGK
jgi:hypothetical protein